MASTSISVTHERTVRKAVLMPQSLWERLSDCAYEQTGRNRQNSAVIINLVKAFVDQCEADTAKAKAQAQAAKDLAVPDTDTEDDAHKRGEFG